MYWLGIDIGSISTDLVLMDDKSNIVEAYYLKTGSKPMEAVKSGLKALSIKYKSEDIAGVGVTGSGRNLGGAIVGGDIIKNEITAHGRAVGEIDREIRTVIEIGGQDSKLITLENGLVKDFSMNTVCAAGTGSFLDRQAARMGVSIEELSESAFKARYIETVAGRCSVFAESDLIHKQQAGASPEALMAGMCHALALSYLSNVARGKKLEDKICFQGGVASNRGMVRAFENILKCEIVIPKYHKVMGAYGAALLVKDNAPSKSNFRGFEALNEALKLKNTHCVGCSNECKITAIYDNFGNYHGQFGDKCGKYLSHTNCRNSQEYSVPNKWYEN